MYSLDDVAFLKHILDEIDFILELTSKTSVAIVISDEIKKRAAIRSLEIIGEAAKNISTTMQKKYPEIPWREVGDTRNRIIHEYFDIDYELIKDILEHDIPELKPKIKKIIIENS